MRSTDTIEVLKFAQSAEDGIIRGFWEVERTLFAERKNFGGVNVYSSYAVAQRSSTVFYVRREQIDTRRLVRHEGRTYIITNGYGRPALRDESDRIEINTVPVTMARIKVSRFDGEVDRPVVELDTIIAERYEKYNRDLAFGVAAHGRVLMIPKEIALQVGDSAWLGDKTYVIEVAHELGEDWNEYEMSGREDI